MTRDENRPRRDGAPKRPKSARDDRRPSARVQTPHADVAEATRPQPRQRIAKLMARAGLCSRRDAEAWILDGRVSVNGTLLTSPATDVGAEDTILVDDAPLPQVEKTRLFLFHKPRGLVTSDYDPEGRPTVADFLRDNWPDGPRTVTIGRLDINTEGLLLLTNDGGLARVLELPQTGWVRRYRVRAKGETDQGKLDALASGISVDGVDYVGIEAKLDRIQGSNCWLTMGLREGKNREIKRVLEHLGLEVNRLIRLSFGPFQLLDLPEGAVEEVKTRVLRDQLGDALAAEAGVDLGERPVPVEPRPERPARGDRPQRETRPPRGRPEDGKRPRRAEGASRQEPQRGDRPLDRRRPERPVAEEAPPIRDRPQTGTRKHISTLRAAAKETAQGPRKRIERAETTDRHARTIRVERLVAARDGTAQEQRKRRTPDRPGRYDERGERPSRGHSSPSALGKQERMARSGPRERRPDEAERGDTRRGGVRSPDRSRQETPNRDGRRFDAPRKPAPRSDDRRDRSESRDARAPRSPAPGKRFDALRKPAPRSDDRQDRSEGRAARAPRPSEPGKRFDAPPKPAPRSDDRQDRSEGRATRAPRSSAPGKRFEPKRSGPAGPRSGDHPHGKPGRSAEGRSAEGRTARISPKPGPKGPRRDARGPSKPKR